MPQITLQITDNIQAVANFYQLLTEIHDALNSIAGIKIDNCKSRVFMLDNYLIGDGADNNGFIHLEVKILEGRADKIKSKIGKNTLQILKNYFIANDNLLDIQITVEIIDIKKNCYYKYPEGTLIY